MQLSNTGLAEDREAGVSMTQQPCSKFTDNYELKEELGKWVSGHRQMEDCIILLVRNEEWVIPFPLTVIVNHLQSL